MAATVSHVLLTIFCLILFVAASNEHQSVITSDVSSKPRFIVYLTGQHDIVPEPPLVTKVTHVALAFIRSETFNVPNQSEWSLFTSVAQVRPKFADGTQILVAIGGWGDTDGFSKAAKTKESRKVFANNVKAMVDAMGADGVDIDWEYPGGNGEDYKVHQNSEKAWEIEAYPKLLAEIRKAIGPSKIISAAVPGLERDMIAFTDSTLPKIKQSVNFLNVMTYDLMNRRDTWTKHHSGVTDSKSSLRNYSDRGIGFRHTNVGLGFYIKWFKTAGDTNCARLAGLGCSTELMEDPITGADLGKAGAFSWHDDVPSELIQSFERAMENGIDDGEEREFEGHYFMDYEEKIFWSWDSPKSIRRKLDIILEDINDVGGIFIWGLGEDAPHFEHLKSVDEVLNNIGKGTESAENWPDNSKLEHREL